VRVLKDLVARDPSTSFWTALLFLLILTSAFLGIPAPLGILALGAVIGGLIAFISIGLVLVYRTNRIINFAHADIGATAVVLTILLVREAEMSYVLGTAIGLATALALGWLIEKTVVRRFFKAPRLILTVATILLAQMLIGIQVLLPRAFRTDIVSPNFPTPFTWRFSIPDPRGLTPSVHFDGNHLLAVLAVPVVAIALTAFLRGTAVGKAARALADNAERASLLGIPVRRISTIIWVIAAGLSALGALLRAPTTGLSVTGGAFGASLLVRALAPAVVARMENLRTTFVAALVLGIVDQAAFYRTLDESLSNTILFVIILVALLLQRRGLVTRADDVAGTWQSVKEVRPIPHELKRVPEVRVGLPLLTAAALLAFVLFGAFATDFRLEAFSLIMIFGIIGISLVILTGWAGQVSLGQMAFVAVGGGVTGQLILDKGWNPLLALVVAGLIGSFVAIVIGLPALRIRGLFLAVSTVSFGLFMATMGLSPQYFGWMLPSGRIPRPEVLGVELNSKPLFFFVLLILLLVMASVRSLRRSRTGRVLIGARDNDRAIRSFGVNVTAARLTAFALSGFYAALAGGLLVIHQNDVEPSAFTVQKGLEIFVMVVVGGLGSVPGVLLGAVLYGSSQLFFSGLVARLAIGFLGLVLLMIIPGGLGHVLFGWRDALLRFLAVRRGIVVPSLVADVRVEESVLLPGARRLETAEPDSIEELEEEALSEERERAPEEVT
jgi:branched-chain amino acid transport system permease protein